MKNYAFISKTDITLMDKIQGRRVRASNLSDSLLILQGLDNNHTALQELMHTTVFRKSPKVTSTPSGSGQKTIRRQLSLDKLPSEFEHREFIEIAASFGIPQSTA